MVPRAPPPERTSTSSRVRTRATVSPPKVTSEGGAAPVAGHSTHVPPLVPALPPAPAPPATPKPPLPAAKPPLPAVTAAPAAPPNPAAGAAPLEPPEPTLLPPTAAPPRPTPCPRPAVSACVSPCCSRQRSRYEQPPPPRSRPRLASRGARRVDVRAVTRLTARKCEKSDPSQACKRTSAAWPYPTPRPPHARQGRGDPAVFTRVCTETRRATARKRSTRPVPE